MQRWRALCHLVCMWCLNVSTLHYSPYCRQTTICGGLFLLLVFHKVLLVHKLQLSSESAVTLSVWSIGSSMLEFVGWFKSKRVREHIQGSSPFLHTDSWIPLSASHSPSDQVMCPGGISDRTQENGFHTKTANSSNSSNMDAS